MIELALQQVVNGLLVGAIYAVMALGLMVILGILNVINMAQGELYMLGGYVSYFAIVVLRVDYFTSIAVAMLVTAGCGVVVERLAVRPLRGRPSFTVFLSTFAVSMVLQDLAQIAWTPEPREIPTPFAPEPIVIGPVFLTRQRIFVFLLALAMVAAFTAFLRWSRMGMAIRALARDREAALLMGIDAERMHMLTFALGSALAAAAGALLGAMFNVYPTMGELPLGGVLLLSIAFLPEGLVGLWARAARSIARRRGVTVAAEPGSSAPHPPMSEPFAGRRGLSPRLAPTGNDSLDVRGITKRFGGLTVLRDVTFTVRPGEIVGLIGPNGAGKTTLFNIATGFLEPTAGEVRYGGERVSGRSPAGVAERGITRTFQITSLFPDLSVEDNVRIAAHTWARSGLAGVLSRSQRYQATEREIDGAVAHALALTRLTTERRMQARALSYGAQRGLEMAVALVTRSRLLLLDEPAAGLDAQETERLRELIVTLRACGTTILVIEHDMRLVMGMCDRVVVLNYGELIAEGAPREIVEDPQVVEAYLGTPAAAGHA